MTCLQSRTLDKIKEEVEILKVVQNSIFEYCLTNMQNNANKGTKAPILSSILKEAVLLVKMSLFYCRI